MSCLAVRDEEGDFCHLTVWTYSSLSGLLLLDKEGKVSLLKTKWWHLTVNKTGKRGRPCFLLSGPGILSFWSGGQED